MPSHDELIARLTAAGQNEVSAHLASLSPEAADRLAKDLESVDLDHIARLSRGEGGVEEDASPLEPLPRRCVGEDEDADSKARQEGLRLLDEGRVAAFVVAGGQGTRLGHPGPKGTYPATPIRNKPLFAVFAEKLLALSRRHGAPVPFYVMTSPGNHEDTTRFFAENEHFGLAEDQVRFFSQGTMPAVTEDGKLILAGEDRLFRNPDGHGGSLKALSTSGALADMAGRGIEHIFYFQVDNPLVPIGDPLFLGYHAAQGSDFSSVVVRKTDPAEKVGVLAQRNGKACLVEYSELGDAERDARNPDGSLRFDAGNIAIHLLRRSFVEGLNEGEFGLPFRQARKKIPSWAPDGPVEIGGIKFETFVFDALPLAANPLVLEAPRGEVFSPIKNREGSDSPETSRRDQSALFAAWLEAAGIRVPRDEAGYPRHRVEISPLAADGPEALRSRADLPSAIDDDFILEP